MIAKELLAENLAYLSMVCSVSLKHLRKLDKWRTKEEVAGLKKLSTADEQYLKEEADITVHFCSICINFCHDSFLNPTKWILIP